MLGSHAGLLLKDNKDLLATGCICHRIHLAAEWAAKDIPKNIGSFVIDIYFYMEKSANRNNAFKDYQEECGTPQTAVSKHCPTRWLSLANTCDWVLEQWEPLLLFFQAECDSDGQMAKEVANKNSHSCRKANVLENLKSKTMKAYVTYLSYVLPVFNAANLTFQKEEPQIHRQCRLMLRLLKDLLLMFVKPSALTSKLPVDVDFTSQYNIVSDKELLIGQECKALLETFNSSKKKEFYTVVRKFLSTAVRYLCKHLPVKDPLIINSEVADVTLRNSASFSSIKFFTDRSPVFIPPGSCVDRLEKQFKLYQCINLPTGLEELSMLEQWQEIGKLYDDLGEISLPDLPTVMIRILSILHSNASCERIFSLVRKNRADFRASMSVETLQNLVALKQAGGVCYQNKPDKALLRACKGATAERLASSSKKE